jgi:hypothetical protein
MLGWPNHPIGGGWPPVWPRGGSATLRLAVWGWPNHPLRPWGWFGHPQTGCLGVVRPPLGPNGVVWPPLKAKPSNYFLRVWPKGQPNHLLGPWGWSNHPKAKRGGLATPYGVVQLPQYISSSFFWIFFK